MRATRTKKTGPWNGDYSREKGDVVKVKKGHPFQNYRGTVEISYGGDVFGVCIAPSLFRDAPSRTISIHTDNLIAD